MYTIRIVVSGFEPFEGEDCSPSAEVAQALADRGIAYSSSDIQVEITAVTLPLSFDEAWPTLLEAIEQVHPHIIIAGGLKHHARGIDMPRCAMNHIDNERADAYNVIPHTSLIEQHGEAAYWTKLPLHYILQSFTADNIPALVSSNAGTYICNVLFYRLLHWVHEQAPQETWVRNFSMPDVLGSLGMEEMQGVAYILAGFVSYPRINETTRREYGLPLETMIQAGTDVIREAINYYINLQSRPMLLGLNEDNNNHIVLE